MELLEQSQSCAQELGFVLRHAPETLISTAERDYWLSLLSRLPPVFRMSYLECRLGRPRGQVDLALSLGRNSTCYPEEWLSHPLWQKVAQQHSCWSKEFDSFQAAWLEFDRSDTPDEIPLPSLFWRLDGKRECNWEAPLEGLASPELVELCRRQPLESPEGSRLMLAWMPGRSTQRVRVVQAITDLESDLARLKRQGHTVTPQFRNLLEKLAHFTDELALSYDIGLEPEERLGVECRLFGQPPQKTEWAALLQDWVDSGWCLPEMRRHVLDWVGWEQRKDCPEQWPAYLQQGDSLFQGTACSVIWRRLSHLKLSYMPTTGEVEAKVYLVYGHDWMMNNREK